MTENADKKIEKNPEVTEKASRRRFTTEYKRRIALEAQRCTEPGEIGALLRREGLYASVVSRWRRQLQEESLTSSKKSSRISPRDLILQWSRSLSRYRHSKRLLSSLK